MDPSNPPTSRALGYKSRHVAKLNSLPLIGRSTFVSRIQQAAAELPKDVKYPALVAFLRGEWIRRYLRDLRFSKIRYPKYEEPKTGIFPLARGPLRIAVAADWATGTLESETVAWQMSPSPSYPDYTLHLGDIYYMGETGEVEENCLGKKTHHYKGVDWPLGSRGSFALMGNHEMYSGGHGYHARFLKRLGLFEDDGSLKDPQLASYFCLEADDWVILGLDTGYHSGGFPLLAPVPALHRFPFLNVDARFDDEMMDWLRQTVRTLERTGGAKKAVLLLTHHQPVSSFETSFRKPARQLAELDFFKNREFVWLYGHEHRLTIYNQTCLDSLRFHPRCIGHGGMPVSKTKLRKPDPRILYYDPRTHPIDEKDPQTLVGYNGHALLHLDGKTLRVEYCDILENAVIFEETFVAQENGALLQSRSQPSGSPLKQGWSQQGSG